MRNPDYEAWLLKDLWRVSEFVLLACEFNPDIGEGDEQVLHSLDEDTQEWVQEQYAPCGRLSDMIYRSIAVGEFKVMDLKYRLKEVARPIDLIRWAIRKGVEIPLPLLEFEQTFVDDEPNDDSQPAPSRREVQKLRTKMRNKKWNEEYMRLQEEQPGRRDKWYAFEIQQTIAQDRAVGTVRRNMKL